MLCRRQRIALYLRLERHVTLVDTEWCNFGEGLRPQTKTLLETDTGRCLKLARLDAVRCSSHAAFAIVAVLSVTILLKYFAEVRLHLLLD